MIDEHQGQCIYENGRFELRETDNAIIDLKGDFPPILIASNTVDDGSEPNCADTRSVLHLLNELATKCSQLKKENEQLKQQIKDMKIRFKRKYDHEFDEIVDELW